MQWECEYRSCKVRGNTEVSHHVAKAVQARPHQDGKYEILMHLSIEIYDIYVWYVCDTQPGSHLAGQTPQEGHGEAL